MTAGLVWLNAVIDLPATRFVDAGRFWTEISDSTQGEVHPDHDEFVHLNPSVGEMYLELQRIDDGPARVHLDLVVDDIPGWAARAVDLGAVIVADPGHVVLRSPGGVPFCVVPASRSWHEPPRFPDALPRIVEQLTIDVAPDAFTAELQFWSSLTGWPAQPAIVDEFRTLDVPDHMPFGIAVQCLGDDDGDVPRSHLDLLAHRRLAEVVSAHVANGAAVVHEAAGWTVLRDPAGMTYCIGPAPA